MNLAMSILIDIFIKIARNGEQSLNGITIKKFKQKEIPFLIIEIKKQRKKYRFYGMITKEYFFILEAEDKKSNKTPLNVKNTLIRRSKQIFNSYNL